MAELGIIRPTMKNHLRELRNRLVHEAEEPPLCRNECELLSDTAWYYLKAAPVRTEVSSGETTLFQRPRAVASDWQSVAEEFGHVPLARDQPARRPSSRLPARGSLRISPRTARLGGSGQLIAGAVLAGDSLEVL
jgi:hypothetical protein